MKKEERKNLILLLSKSTNMKNGIFFISLLLVFLLATTAFRKTAISSEPTSSVGDVRYSVLPPDAFMKLNPGWILMDGAESKTSDSIFKKSTLFLDYQFKSVPDARGVFVRGMNMGRPLEKGDPDGDLPIGRYQPDGIKKHTHEFSISFGYFCGWVNNNVWTGDRPGNPMSVNNPECKIKISNSGENLSGEETRPRNIALYVYIKVN